MTVRIESDYLLDMDCISVTRKITITLHGLLVVTKTHDSENVFFHGCVINSSNDVGLINKYVEVSAFPFKLCGISFSASDLQILNFHKTLLPARLSTKARLNHAADVAIAMKTEQ